MKQHVGLLARSWSKRGAAGHISVRTQSCPRRAGVRLWAHFDAIGEIDWRTKDDMLARPPSGIHFHPRAEIARHSNVADLGLVVPDHCDLKTVAVEDEGLCRNEEGRRLARYLELDRAVNAGRQRTVRIGNIDLGQERARAALQRVGDPGHVA